MIVQSVAVFTLGLLTPAAYVIAGFTAALYISGEYYVCRKA
jgi:hypothetical protein